LAGAFRTVFLLKDVDSLHLSNIFTLLGDNAYLVM
jgi:hypothetical protein